MHCHAKLFHDSAFVCSLFLRLSPSFLVHSNCCRNIFTFGRLLLLLLLFGVCICVPPCMNGLERRGNISVKVEGTRTFARWNLALVERFSTVGESGSNSAANFSTLS